MTDPRREEGKELNATPESEAVEVDLNHYLRRCTVCAWANSLLYWITRLVAVIGGVALPFTLATPRLATTLSFGIAIAAALDTIYRPSDNWKTYPNAYDELFLAKAKYVGTYDQASEIYNTTNIERRLWKGQVKLERLVSEANDKVKRLGRHD